MAEPKQRRPLLNPVARLELRRRFRAFRAHGMFTTYLAIVSGLALVLYLGASLSTGSNAIGAGRTVGSGLFYIVTGLLLVLVCFIGPAFAVSAISGERERATLDLLRVTPVTARHIVWAKFWSAFGFVLLLVLVTLPIYTLALLIGGVEPAQLLMVVGTITASGFAFVALGVCVSAYTDSRLGSTIVTYALVLLVVVGAAVLTVLLSPVFQSVRATGAGAAGQVAQLVLVALLSVSPVSAIVAGEQNYQTRGDLFTITLDPLPGMSAADAPTLPAPFVVMAALYLVAGLVMLALAVRRMRRPDAR